MFDVVWRGCAAAWLIACTSFAAFVLARVLAPRARVLERAAATAISGAWLATAGFVVLAGVHAFTLPAALAGTFALAALAWRRERHALRSLRLELRAWRRIARRARRGRERTWCIALGLCALPVLLHPLLVPPLGWDALTYHAVKAAIWVQDAGALHLRAPGPWSFYGTSFAGGSVLTSWTMLPFHSDLLAGAADSLLWVWLGLALWALARELGVREPLASAASSFALALPAIRSLIGAGYDEPLLCLCFIAGCVFALRFAVSRKAGYALLAFAAIGLAIGAKLTFARPCAVVIAFVCLHALGRELAVRRSLRISCAGAAIAGVVIAPWPWRALAETGLPLSPLPITFLGMQLGAAPPELQWYMHRPQLIDDAAAELRTLADLFGDLGHGREVPTALVLVPLALAPLGLWSLRRARGGAAWMLGACIAADMLSYASAELRVVRLRYLDTMSRFVLVTVLLAIVLSAVWAARRPAIARSYAHALRAGALFLLALYASVGWSSTSAIAAAALAGALAACAVIARAARTWPRAARGVVYVALAVLCVPALATARTSLRYTLMQSDFAIHAHATYFARDAQALDRQGRAHVIAVTGGPQQDMDRWFVYPFLGEHLQNRVLYVSPLASGALSHFGTPALHRAFFEQADPAAWVRRLRSAGVTHVVSFDPPSVELRIMQDNPRLFRHISDAQQHAYGVFELAAAAPR